MPLKEVILVVAVVALALSVRRVEQVYRFYVRSDASALDEDFGDRWNPRVVGYEKTSPFYKEVYLSITPSSEE